jgi:hypothetical protein
MEIKEPVFVYVYWLCQVLTFLFIDVTVVWFVLLSVLCFCFCFQMLKCIKKGYYVLDFFIGVENRDNMTKELSLIFQFFVLFFMIIFLHGILIPYSLSKQGLFCLGVFFNRDTLCINFKNWTLVRE